MGAPGPAVKLVALHMRLEGSLEDVEVTSDAAADHRREDRYDQLRYHPLWPASHLESHPDAGIYRFEVLRDIVVELRGVELDLHVPVLIVLGDPPDAFIGTHELLDPPAPPLEPTPTGPSEVNFISTTSFSHRALFFTSFR